MSAQKALDLSKIDPPQWRVLVSGTVYGPYTLGQMQSFIYERRIRPGTKIADGDGGAFLAAEQHPALLEMFHMRTQESETTAAEVSNYLIIARLTGTGEMQLISVLNRLGKFAEIMPGVWALRSSIKQNKLREKLQATIVSGDQVMIANATSGRLAWLNLGPEADVHIRSVWDAKLDAA
ncbi:hypothetical protein [Henriciella litoralis]|uniref:hypothetical protein n=1 Tax=Henriciella litoralis TaxID=568102 RepID=UPI000A079C98|nr:hypothetical protein [Henriciella litoralis]